MSIIQSFIQPSRITTLNASLRNKKRTKKFRHQNIGQKKQQQQQQQQKMKRAKRRQNTKWPCRVESLLHLPKALSEPLASMRIICIQNSSCLCRFTFCSSIKYRARTQQPYTPLNRFIHSLLFFAVVFMVFYWCESVSDFYFNERCVCECVPRTWPK